MTTIGVLYATREGQTRRIANYVAQALRDAGHGIEVVDVAHVDGVEVERYDGVVLASSVHIWRHPPEMHRFVKEHRMLLAQVPTAFLSISLCEAGAEDNNAKGEDRAKCRLNAYWMMDRFFATTRWHPDVAQPVAGALRYTKYSMLTKLLMQQVARSAGASTDTSRDHEYTDWASLDETIARFGALIARATPRPVAVA